MPGRPLEIVGRRQCREMLQVVHWDTTDGVMYAHIFQIMAESPADAVDILWHLAVRYCSGKTERATPTNFE